MYEGKSVWAEAVGRKCAAGVHPEATKTRLEKEHTMAEAATATAAEAGKARLKLKREKGISPRRACGHHGDGIVVHLL